jgi:hypothetical protein
MNRQQILALALMFMLLASPLSAQQPQPTAARPPQPQQSATLPPAQQPPPAQDDDDVVRITTNLVQLDAVVTDKDGRVVTDLRAEDFEVLEDGRPQTVTNLSFIPLEPSPATNAAAAADLYAFAPRTGAPHDGARRR